jgi:hypothetical protein
MQAPIADAVHALFNHGLSLRDRLEGGEPVQWALEQTRLKQLLAFFDTQAEDSLESENELGLVFSERGSPEEFDRLTLATIRYALTCWLGEWFAHDRPEGTLERELVAGSDAGAKFWEEARYADTRGDLESLEVMFLCVMLGFRGNQRDKPEQLEAWAARTRAKLEQAVQSRAMPAGLEPPVYASAHADGLPVRRMAFSVLLTLSLMLPLVLVLWWRR